MANVVISITEALEKHWRFVIANGISTLWEKGQGTKGGTLFTDCYMPLSIH